MKNLPTLRTLKRFAALLGCSLTTASIALPASAPILRSDGHAVNVDPAVASYNPHPPLSGDLHLVGGGGIGTDVEGLMAAWAEIFHRAHPLVKIHLAIYTSGCAPSALVEERAEVGIMTRDVWPFEVTLYRNKKYKLLEVVAAGAVYDQFGYAKRQCIYVNKDNPIAKLTLAQVDAIFSKTRKRGYPEDITRWGQLGLTGEWADKPINLYGNIAQPDGNPYYFQLRVLEGGDWKDGLRTLREPNAIAGDRYAIGFGPANHAGGRGPDGLWRAGELENAKAVSLAETEAGPYYDDSFENVLARTYPLSRYVSLFLNQYPDKSLNPLAEEFIRVALSQEGQQAVARTIFLPLPASTVNDSLGKLK